MEKKNGNDDERIRLGNIIAPAFFNLHFDIKNRLYTHYWVKGGRGSTKSSFISIELVLGIMKAPNTNAVVLRKVGETLKDSVFAQLEWAIETLGCSHLWQAKLSPLEMIYVPTGQKIVFRGGDKPTKIKSTKFKTGYCSFIWYEEVDEFSGPWDIRIINQSLMRGGDKFRIFYSYNPPKSRSSWVNKEVMLGRRDKKVHHSTYLDVPKKWLGDQFFVEAEHLKEVNLETYSHEYMGEVTGAGGQVFSNATIREISDREIKGFDQINRGLDWGYAVDPLHYTKNYYDRKKRRLYIFGEYRGVGISNRVLSRYILKDCRSGGLVICDSAEPKSIADLVSYGICAIGTKKGPDSVSYGIKWLQDLEEIVIDPIRCPATAEEFYGYHLESDGGEGFIPRFSDKNNHSIDATRYSLLGLKPPKAKKEKEFLNFSFENEDKDVLRGSRVVF